jgi:adenylate cyclase
LGRPLAAAKVAGVDRPLLFGVLVALLGAGAFLRHRSGHDLPLIEGFERRTLDQRFLVRGPTPCGDDIVLIGYDEETLRRTPALFDKRAGWARVIDAIAALHPRAIGVDALLSEPEELLPAPLHDEVERYLGARPPEARGEADHLLERVDNESHGDAALAQAIGHAGNVVLALHLGSERSGMRPAPAAIARAKYGQVLPGSWDPPVISETRALLPVLAQKAKSLGFINLFEDETRTVRAVVLALTYQDSVFAPLAVQLVALARGVGRAGLAYLGNEHAIQIGPDRFQLNREGALLLNFRGPRGTFPVLSAADVVEGKIAPERLRDKVVLLGVTHLGTDTTRTSFGAGVPGLEIHATTIDNLLRRDPLVRTGWIQDGLCALALGLVTALLFWPRLRLPASARLLAAIAALMVYLAATQWLFVHRQRWLPAIGPTLVWAVVAMTGLVLGYAREGLERRRVRRAFSHYLADGLIDEVLRDPSALSLGGARRRLTVLFSDIRDFTTLSEGLEPEQLVRLLNEYLTPMTRAVLREGGLVDKFIGDAVMAFFGAPVAHPDHAARSLRAVLGMHEALELLRPVFERLGVRVDIGVGVNTGDMAVGNMGSTERFNYTVMGDAVNLASRLEGLTKAYGVFCVVGQETREAASDEFSFRELDLVQVKGKHEPVRIYELLSGPGRRVAQYREPERFAAGLAAFRDGRFTEARSELEAFRALNPDDRATRDHLARLDQLGPVPPAGWRGVRVFESK